MVKVDDEKLEFIREFHYVECMLKKGTKQCLFDTPPPTHTVMVNKDQRTNGPVNAHLISWPCKKNNIQILENIWYRNDLDLQYSHTFMKSISCLYLPAFRSQASIVSEKSTVFTFSYRKVSFQI